MSEARRAKRKDGNQNAIAAALVKEGYLVFDTSPLGRGYPDLTVNVNGLIVLLEVKDLRGTMTTDEEKFHLAWRDAPVYVVFDEFEARSACRDAVRPGGAVEVTITRLGETWGEAA